jgi:hypothetical protein
LFLALISTRTRPYNSRDNASFYTGKPAAYWESNNNLLTEYKFLGISYACILAFVGSASMMFHASLTLWGASVDVASLYFYSAWLVIYTAAKLFYSLMNHQTLVIITVATYATLMLGLILAMSLTDVIPDNLVNHFIYAAIAAEFASRCWLWRQRTVTYWIGGMGLFFFGLGYALWWISKSPTSLFCDPNSWFQGHALWHLFAGISLGWFYFYALSERTYTCSPDHRPDATKSDALSARTARTRLSTLDSNTSLPELQDDDGKSISPDEPV